jgi:hypothetical protein
MGAVSARVDVIVDVIPHVIVSVAVNMTAAVRVIEPR